MAREAYLKEGAPVETIKYTYTSAVSAGEVLFVDGLGVLIASAAYDADGEGVYYIKGLFQFPITSAVAITQGTKCYWDVSANKVIASTSASLALGDPYLGRAAAAGSAAGGYVDIEINNNRIDCSAGGSLLPSHVVIAAGLQTCVNVTLVTNATLETILLTHVLATDIAVAGYADAPDGDASSRVVWAKTNAGSVTVGLSTPASASAPTARLAYQVVRSI